MPLHSVFGDSNENRMFAFRSFWSTTPAHCNHFADGEAGTSSVVTKFFREILCGLVRWLHSRIQVGAEIRRLSLYPDVNDMIDMASITDPLVGRNESIKSDCSLGILAHPGNAVN